MEYRIIRADLTVLEAKVMEAMKEGFIPLGGAFPASSGSVYGQSMWRTFSEEAARADKAAVKRGGKAVKR